MLPSFASSSASLAYMYTSSRTRTSQTTQDRCNSSSHPSLFIYRLRSSYSRRKFTTLPAPQRDTESSSARRATATARLARIMDRHLESTSDLCIQFRVQERIVGVKYTERSTQQCVGCRSLAWVTVANTTLATELLSTHEKILTS